MLEYQILFLDIDGTILRPDHSIEVSTKIAITEMKRKGIEVVLATGRPLHELHELAAELEINSFISYNGSYAVYNGQEVYKKHIDSTVIEKYLAIASKHQHDLILYSSTENILVNPNSSKTRDFLRRFLFTKNKPFSKNDVNEIFSATLITNHHGERELYPTDNGVILSPINVDGMSHSFDLLVKDINKGVAVQAMLNALNIPAKSAIAFGDGLNDKEMLAFVGEGVAMGNSNPDLFQYANFITTDVCNSGIYNGLKQLGLLPS